MAHGVEDFNACLKIYKLQIYLFISNTNHTPNAHEDQKIKSPTTAQQH